MKNRLTIAVPKGRLLDPALDLPWAAWHELRLLPFGDSADAARNGRGAALIASD